MTDRLNIGVDVADAWLAVDAFVGGLQASHDQPEPM